MTGSPLLSRHPFSVALDVFEGPLDLLLSLVQAEKLEITEVALVEVTGQYLARLRSGEQIEHRDLADFVAIGARLIELKSRALLPSPQREPPEEPEPDPDSLVALLRRYQQFKQAAALLREREEEALRGFPRLAPPPEVPPLPGLSHVTLERLAAIVERALARAAPAPEPGRYDRPRITVREKMAEIVHLLRLGGRLSFARLVSGCRSRDEVVAAFFAVLELTRAQRLVPCQHDPFGEILLEAHQPDRTAANSAREPEADGRLLDETMAARAMRYELEPELAGVE